jgi:hypothetical protein
MNKSFQDVFKTKYYVYFANMPYAKVVNQSFNTKESAQKLINKFVNNKKLFYSDSDFIIKKG